MTEITDKIAEIIYDASIWITGAELPPYSPIRSKWNKSAMKLMKNIKSMKKSLEGAVAEIAQLTAERDALLEMGKPQSGRMRRRMMERRERKAHQVDDVAVEVKPLVWVAESDDGDVVISYKAECAGHTYTVDNFYSHWTAGFKKYTGPYALEDAKAAQQDKCRLNVLSAITASPESEVAVEAREKALNEVLLLALEFEESGMELMPHHIRDLLTTDEQSASLDELARFGQEYDKGEG